MTKKKELILTEESAPEETTEEIEDEDDDDCIEAPVIPPKKVRKGVIEPYNVKPKEKKVVTQSQLDNFAKGREALRVKRERINAEKARLAEIEKTNLENKIVKKALTIQKRKLKKETVIDEISDDDTPIEEIKNTVQKRRTIKETVYMEAPVPRISFI